MLLITYNKLNVLRWVTALKNNKQETEDVLWKGKTITRVKDWRRCSQIAWQEWGGRGYFPSFCTKMSVKRKQQSQHAGKNPNPDIADSHTPQIIIKIYIHGLYKDLKWFKRGWESTNDEKWCTDAVPATLHLKEYTMVKIHNYWQQ